MSDASGPRTGDLSPFVPTLRADVEAAVRAVLSLRPNVGVELLRVAGEAAPEVHARLHLPNGQRLELALAHPASERPAVRAGRFARLAYRGPGPGAAADPHHDDALAAVLRLFAATEARRGGAPAEALWAAAARVRRYADVQDYMYRQVSRGTMGTTAYLRLGFRCNQDCAFCWQGRDWPEPPPERYAAWLDEIAAAGVRHLSLTGGEPTLHRELPALIARAAGVHGMHVMLQTNAIRLRRRAFAETLRDAGLRVLFVSFHSADPAVSDAMTRAPGTWARTVEGVETALAVGFVVILNCVVEGANAAGLPEHAAFIAERFVRAFPDNPVRSVSYSHPAEYHDATRWDAGMRPLDEVRGPLVEAARRLTAAGVYVETMGTCGFPPCLFRDEPALIRLVAPEDAARMDARDRDSRTFGEACGRCAARARCLGPRKAYLERFGDRGLVPFEAPPEAPSLLYDDEVLRRVAAEIP